MTRTTFRGGLTACLAGTLVLTGCSHRARVSTRAHPATTTSSSTSTTSSTTTSTSSTTTTTAPPPPGLGVGARGPQVLSLEQRLDALHYDVGPVDGVFDQTTAYAVTAFQKVQRMARSGRATDDVLAAVATAGPPGPVVPGGGAVRVEVDLPRQVLFLYQGDSLYKILPVSTGSGQRFCVEGQCERAITPGGSFRIYRRASGWETSKLGKLYNSQYFNAGVAIHGSPSVPAYPASHGCVRIPMSAAQWFPSKVSLGTPVYVAGGVRAPAPFTDTLPPPPKDLPTVPVAPAPPPPPTTHATLLPPVLSTSTTRPRRTDTTPLSPAVTSRRFTRP